MLVVDAYIQCYLAIIVNRVSQEEQVISNGKKEIKLPVFINDIHRKPRSICRQAIRINYRICKIAGYNIKI